MGTNGRARLSRYRTYTTTRTGALIWYHRNRASAFVTNLTAEGLTQSLATFPDPLMNRTFGGRISGSGMTRTDAQKLAKSNTTTLDLAIIGPFTNSSARTASPAPGKTSAHPHRPPGASHPRMFYRVSLQP